MSSSPTVNDVYCDREEITVLLDIGDDNSGATIYLVFASAIEYAQFCKGLPPVSEIIDLNDLPAAMRIAARVAAKTSHPRGGAR